MTRGCTVRLEQIGKRYGSLTAADRVDLEIEAGSVVAVVGASGSGKSTLLHLIGAMDRPDTGTITVDGEEITTLDRRRLAAYRRTVGFVFQRFHLLPALSVLDNVLSPLLVRRTGFDRAARAHEVLESVGLGDRTGDLPSQLSGGEQQRVAIARALVGRPRLLLADEPTGNLDTRTGAEVIDLLLDVRERAGTTVLLVTHDPRIAARCDRLVRIADGAVTDDDPLTAEPGAVLDRIGRLRPS